MRTTSLIVLFAFATAPHADDRPAAMDGILKRLKENNTKERIKAAQECAKRGPKAKAADADLCRVAFDPFCPEAQQPAVDALVKVRPDLGPPVAVFFHLKDPAAKCIDAADAIGKIGPDAVMATAALMRGI